MNKRLIMMSGIPGSGKSTYANELYEHPTAGIDKWVSRDQIRFSLLEDGEDYFHKEKQVYDTFVSEIKKALDNGQTVIADATHINEASRTKLLRALGTSLKDCCVEIIFFKVPVQKALQRNENRINTRFYVPEQVIRRMAMQITVPTFEEGFDIIHIIDDTNEKREHFFRVNKETLDG
jgi:predicted kinase